MTKNSFVLLSLIALMWAPACGDSSGSGNANGNDDSGLAPIDSGDARDSAGLDVASPDIEEPLDVVDVQDTTPGDGTCDTFEDCAPGEICVDLLPGPDNGICTFRCTEDEDCDADEDCVVIGTGEVSYEACLDVDFCLDQDEDGFGTGPGCIGGDCEDLIASINPGADEVCNGTDDDCDGVVDDNTLTSGDDCDTGFAGVCGEGRITCIEGADACVARYEASAETCDGRDNDCDGEVDNDASDAQTWFADGDGDRFGRDETAVTTCARPEGFVTDGGDCDDALVNVNPGSNEVCDGLDNDCDGTVDGVDAVGSAVFYEDTDGDGFGDPDSSRTGCAAAGWVTNARDCNDNDRFIHPDAVDICDTIDNDCNGAVDDGGDTGRQWFRDVDGDGYGDAAVEMFGCGEDGWVTNSTDCNDGDRFIHPGADDVCDGVDNNCSGTIDDGAVRPRTYYQDTDGDTYGSPDAERFGCAEEGWVTNSRDCDDTKNFINPSREDVCDGFDNDCSGVVDDGPVPARLYYQDSDGDTYGDLNSTRMGCAEDGWVTNSRDCDDGRNFINPSREDVCDGFDNDCSGVVDDGAVPARLYYEDTDGDGFGDPASERLGCAEGGWVTNDLDCNDRVGTIHPDAEDVCDGVDNDCTGTADDDPAYGSIWYLDGDGDSYGDPAVTTRACAAPAGYIARAQDCNDAVAAVNPSGTEVCNGRDDNCRDGIDEGVTTTFYRDSDGDTYGNADNTREACTQPTGYVTDATDCLDSNSSAFPGNPEVCDGVDNDCAGGIDNGVGTTWYINGDGDAYGGSTSVIACTQPAGTSAVTGDCNDANGNVYPGAQELCATAYDDDCDGETNEGVTYLPIGGSAPPDATIFYLDADDDGQGDEDAPDFVLSPLSMQACRAQSICLGFSTPFGCIGEQFDYVSNRLDCDDSSPRAQTPTGIPRNEVVDGYDNECNGSRDDGLSCTRVTFCRDNDGDGWGARSIFACVKPVDDSPSRWTTADRCGDVDDDDDTIH